jgi:hypothetical protein
MNEFDEAALRVSGNQHFDRGLSPGRTLVTCITGCYPKETSVERPTVSA